MWGMMGKICFHWEKYLQNHKKKTLLPRLDISITLFSDSGICCELSWVHKGSPSRFFFRLWGVNNYFPSFYLNICVDEDFLIPRNFHSKVKIMLKVKVNLTLTQTLIHINKIQHKNSFIFFPHAALSPAALPGWLWRDPHPPPPRVFSAKSDAPIQGPAALCSGVEGVGSTQPPTVWNNSEEPDRSQ